MENMEADDLHPSALEMEAEEDASTRLPSDQKMESEISPPGDIMEVFMQSGNVRGSRKRTFNEMDSGSSNVLIINGDDSLESGVYRREKRNHAKIEPPTYTKSSFNFLSSGQLQTTINYKVVYTRSIGAFRSPRTPKPPAENPLPVVHEDSPLEVQCVYVRERQLLPSVDEEHILRMRCRDWTKFTNRKNSNEDKK